MIWEVYFSNHHWLVFGGFDIQWKVFLSMKINTKLLLTRGICVKLLYILALGNDCSLKGYICFHKSVLSKSDFSGDGFQN